METENYSKDILMQGIARVLGGLLSFVAIFLFTYLFDESEIGDYNLILATINVITSLTTLWLSQSVLRFYNNDNELGGIIILSSLSIITSMLLYFFYAVVTGLSISSSVLFFIITLVLYNVFDAVFRKDRKLKEYVFLELLFSLGRLFPMVVIAQLTHDYNSIFLSQACVLSLFFIFEIICYRTKFKIADFRINLFQVKQYLLYGAPLVGLAISNWFLTTSDRYIIKYLGDSREVGIYSTNYTLANSIYLMFALIVVNAMHPIILSKWESDKEKVPALVSRSLNLYCILMLPILFFGCLKAEVILSMFKGDSYSTYSSVFIWTALGVFIHGISLLCHKYYECTKETNQILFSNIFAAVINVILNFGLIPKFGFASAAFTTCLSYAVYLLVIRVKTHSVFPIRINYRNTLIVLLLLFVFYAFDSFLTSSSVILFFIEGFIFVFYMIIGYQSFHIFDFKSKVLNYLKPKHNQ